MCGTWEKDEAEMEHLRRPHLDSSGSSPPAWQPSGGLTDHMGGAGGLRWEICNSAPRAGGTWDGHSRHGGASLRATHGHVPQGTMSRCRGKNASSRSSTLSGLRHAGDRWHHSTVLCIGIMDAEGEDGGLGAMGQARTCCSVLGSSLGTSVH